MPPGEGRPSARRIASGGLTPPYIILAQPGGRRLVFYYWENCYREASRRADELGQVVTIIDSNPNHRRLVLHIYPTEPNNHQET